MNSLELTGRTRSHIEQFKSPRFAAESDTSKAFFAMRESALNEGIDLKPVSSFRDFESQLKIWNNKYSGKRPLYDKDGSVKDHQSLSEKELVFSILEWSALPGASRHHWGTDLDIVDDSAIPEGYQIQLLPEEYEKGGIFNKLNRWLDKNLQEFGFFRPYQVFQGGVNPEPWHISYKNVSSEALANLSLKLIEETVLGSEIMGKDIVLKELPMIYQNYVLNICT